MGNGCAWPGARCGTNCGRDAGKHPVGVLVPNGYKNASYDRLVVERWRSRYPNANIGYAIPPGIVVVDVDPRNGGDESLRQLGDLPHTVRVLTGGGGQHIYFKHSSGSLPAQLAPGIDIKRGGAG